MQHVNLSSERLIFKPISLEYMRELFTEFNTEITKDMIYSPVKDIQETRKNIQQAIKDMDEGVVVDLVVEDKNTQEFIGRITLTNIHTSTPTICLRVKLAAQGKGYGKEMIKAVIYWAQKNIDFEYIAYKVNKENFRSIQLVKDIGGRIQQDETCNPLVKKRTPIGKEAEQYGYVYKIYKTA